MESAFGLALVSGLLHASWNALAKSPGRERAATLAALAISLLAAVLQALLLPPTTSLEARHLPWVLLAGLGEASYVFSLGMAYAKGDLAMTYAVSRASALVFIWPVTWLQSGHTPTTLALGATGLVVVGILLTRRGDGPARWHLGWTLLTGASVAGYHAGYKGAVDGGAPQVLAFIGAISLALPLLLLAVGSAVRSQIPALIRTPRLVAAGLLCAGSFLLMLAALARSESGRILGVRNASVGFALLFALRMGERIDRRQALGLAVLFTGVALFGVEQLLRGS